MEAIRYRFGMKILRYSTEMMTGNDEWPIGYVSVLGLSSDSLALALTVRTDLHVHDFEGIVLK